MNCSGLRLVGLVFTSEAVTPRVTLGDFRSAIGGLGDIAGQRETLLSKRGLEPFQYAWSHAVQLPKLVGRRAREVLNSGETLGG